MKSEGKKKIVIGNWKMNLTVPESKVLAERLKKEITPSGDMEVVVCPSFVSIYPVKEILDDSSIEVGAQNVYFEESGTYTGEVSAGMLRGLADYVILGHSERRRYLHERDSDVKKKVKVADVYGVYTIICVGETLQEKDEGVGKVVVTSQLEAALSQLTPAEVSKVVIAYEPVWSISPSDLICKPKDAAKMIEDLKNLVQALYGEKVLESIRFIYGGSVDDKNIKDFLKEKIIDGFLVGGASLDHQKFATVVKEVGKTAKKVG